MIVPSNQTVSSLRPMICSVCKRANPRSSTPALLQRFMRVSIVCQLPRRLGRPRHWQPCSATCQDRVDDFAAAQTHIAALTRQAVFEAQVLFFGNFHRSTPADPTGQSHLVLTRPREPLI
jgi:hypothetical protein